MEIITDRLRLFPIGDDEMRVIIEKETNPDMKQAYSEMFDGCIKNPDQRMWFAVWRMELREVPGKYVGDFCFKGLGSDGMVEIGYGLYDGFCGKGYMTEAVKAVSSWALKQPDVKRVEAETDPDNVLSQNVLIRSGFVPTGETGEEGPRFLYSGK